MLTTVMIPVNELQAHPLHCSSEIPDPHAVSAEFLLFRGGWWHQVLAASLAVPQFTPGPEGVASIYPLSCLFQEALTLTQQPLQGPLRMLFVITGH